MVTQLIMNPVNFDINNLKFSVKQTAPVKSAIVFADFGHYLSEYELVMGADVSVASI